MRYYVFITVIFLFFCSFPGYSDSNYSDNTPECKKKLLQDCESGVLKRDLICRLLAKNPTETPYSIDAFSKSVRDLDNDIKNNLICARLMGKKRFEQIKIKIINLRPQSWRTYCGEVYLSIDIDRKYSKKIEKIRDNYSEYDGLKFNLPGDVKKQISAYDKRNTYLVIDLVGNVQHAEVYNESQYISLNDRLYGHHHGDIFSRISIKNSSLEFASFNGKIYTSFDHLFGAILQRTDKMVDLAYDYYMKVGITEPKDSKNQKGYMDSPARRIWNETAEELSKLNLVDGEDKKKKDKNKF